MADDSGGGGTAANDTTAAAGMLADAPAQDEAVARAVRELVRHLAAAPRPPEPAGAQPRRPYRVKQVAAALDVSVSAVYRDIEIGKLEAHRIGAGKGTLRVPADAFERYKELLKAAAVTKPAVEVA